jgi:hypothetical protein
MTEPPITLGECKEAGYCFKGARKFCERSGVDFKHFARNGMSVEEAKSKDGWAAVVEHILSVRRQRGKEV